MRAAEVYASGDPSKRVTGGGQGTPTHAGTLSSACLAAARILEARTWQARAYVIAIRHTNEATHSGKLSPKVRKKVLNTLCCVKKTILRGKRCERVGRLASSSDHIGKSSSCASLQRPA